MLGFEERVSMLCNFIFLVLGAFFSWLFTMLYYRKAKKDSDNSIEGLKSHIDKSAENSIKDGDTLNGGRF